MIKRTSQFSVLFVACVLLISCRQTRNYREPNEPLFTGNFSHSRTDSDELIKVVTWNIRYGEKIDQAIAELSGAEALQGADILLLQEMDESGVDSIARSLGYNYVYYPASVSRHHGRNFGNAILSKWPLTNPAKLILPYDNPNNGQQRTATRAVTIIDDKQVLIYSAHMETNVMEADERYEQFEAVVDDVSQEYGFVIAGGDFNTRSPDSTEALENRFDEVGLERASAGVGSTVLGSGAGLALDHVFAKEMAAVDKGVYAETKASDHFPVWVTLSFD